MFIGDIKDLYELMIKHSTVNVEVSLIVIVVAILVMNKIKVLKHSRYQFRFIVSLTIFLIIVNFHLYKMISTSFVVILIALLIAFMITGYFAAKRPILISQYKFKKLEELIKQGGSWDKEDLFSEKPFYMIDFSEIYQYELLHARHWIILRNYKKAYEIYTAIDEKKLFNNERAEVLRKKAYVLYELGDMTR